jgi:hypothetical protein
MRQHDCQRDGDKKEGEGECHRTHLQGLKRFEFSPRFTKPFPSHFLQVAFGVLVATWTKSLTLPPKRLAKSLIDSPGGSSCISPVRVSMLVPWFRECENVLVANALRFFNDLRYCPLRFFWWQLVGVLNDEL